MEYRTRYKIKSKYIIKKEEIVMNEMEQIIMQLIIHSGDALSASKILRDKGE